jgi:hypothetical protein
VALFYILRRVREIWPLYCQWLRTAHFTAVQPLSGGALMGAGSREPRARARSREPREQTARRSSGPPFQFPVRRISYITGHRTKGHVVFVFISYHI